MGDPDRQRKEESQGQDDCCRSRRGSKDNVLDDASDNNEEIKENEETGTNGGTAEIEDAKESKNQEAVDKNEVLPAVDVQEDGSNGGSPKEGGVREEIVEEIIPQKELKNSCTEETRKPLEDRKVAEDKVDAAEEPRAALEYWLRVRVEPEALEAAVASHPKVDQVIWKH